VLGRDASIEVGERHCRLYTAEWKPEAQDKLTVARRKAVSMGVDPELAGLLVEPEYTWKRGTEPMTDHMRNGVDSIRGQDKPRCGIDRAWEEAVVIVMSVESYFKERKVKWDPVNELIV